MWVLGDSYVTVAQNALDHRSSESSIQAGYQQNVIGFGWTNAAFLVFLHDLPKDWVDRLAKAQATSSATQ